MATITITAPTVFFDPQPTPFLLVNDATPITAVVTNDPQNKGVDWTCAPVSACGSFNPTHTASGVPTTYTAPNTVPSGGTVVVTASSTADPLKTNKATITIATQLGNAALNGNYVFEASGRDKFAHVAPSDYQVAGVLQANGNGNITGGELVYEDQPGNGNALDSINSGSYSIGTDGRGTISLTTGDTSIGVNGVLTFSVVMLSGGQGRITQFDATATSSGSLDLQTSFSIKPLSGGYAFVTSGVDGSPSRAPLGVGGVLNVSSGAVSVTGSVMDANDNGTVTTGASVAQGGTVLPPDQLGKVVINVNPAFPSNPSLTYVGFIVDDTHVKLIERDHTFGITGGIAFAQGAATGTFTTSSFSGPVVFGTQGESAPGPTIYAGLFTASSGSITNGVADENAFGTVITDGALSGKYAADSSKTGRVTTSGMQFNGSAGPSLIFYLTGTSNIPALILQVDTTPIETVGAAYTQASGPFTASSFSGAYGMNFAAFPAAGGEDGGTGQITSDGVGSLTPGTVDFNVCNVSGGLCGSFTPTPGVSLAGTFTANTNGRFTGTLTDGNGTIFSASPMSFYVVDSTRVLFIETDTQPTLGIFRQQLAAGTQQISVAFNPQPPSSVQVNSQTQITADTNDSAGVKWSCTPVGACGSFNPTQTLSGNPTTYTAPSTVPSGGTVTVTATSVSDPAVNASAVITITAQQGITVTFNPQPPSSVQINSQTPITADTNDSNGVKWSCTPVGACGSFNPTQTTSGNPTTYTAPATIPNGGTVTVTATSVTDPNAFASAQITITAPITVTFNPPPPTSVQINSLTQITADTNDSSGVNWTVTCGSSNCGSFSPTHTLSGVATTYTAPPAVPSGGTVTVTATSVTDSSVFASAVITITSPVTVSFDPQPPPFLLINGTSPITAVVFNDSQNEGVDWSCTPVGSCGTLVPAHTASGVPTTYTAPSTVPSGGIVVVTASSTAAPTKTAHTSITIATTFGNAALNGNYVFEARGRDSFAHAAPSAYQVAGVLQANGSGTITGGELIYEDQPGNGNALDPITSGSYSIGTDGRGTITLTTQDTSIGVGGVLTFSAVMNSGIEGRITQFDTSATSSGTLELQTPLSAGTSLSGGYAFVTNGVDLANKAPLGMGGVLNVSAGTVSVAGSVMDDNDNGTVTLDASLTSAGSVTAPDPLGKVVINVNPAFPSSPAIALAGFIVDDTHVKLIERDHSFGITGGTAFAQGAATGTFTTASFSGPFVFGTEGESTPGPTIYAGLFLASSGSLNGVADENASGTVITDSALTGNYAADSSKTGRVTTSGMQFNGNPGPSLIFYLTGATNIPALILQVDTTPIETVGAAYTQAAGPFSASSFTGLYGLNFDAFPAAGGEDGGTGQITADGVGNLTPGTVDFNVCNFAGGLCPSFTPTPGVSLGGVFTANPNGRFTGTLTDGNRTIFNDDPIAFYIVDTTRVLFIETDAQPALGVFRQQLSTTAPPITVSFDPPPPTTLQTSSVTPITAVVENDHQNEGVDWTVTCGSSDCGSFSPTHTNSGDPTQYTAPATVPSGGTVTVTATSTADPTKFASANITITVQGITVNFNPPPPPSVAINSMTPITADTNDSAGVNWTVTCGSSNCGSFSPTHTFSGSATTYTAPPTIPTGNTVTVTATSVSDSSAFASAQITITSGVLTVAFDPQPPPFLLINAGSPITAVVFNDSQNLGVDWSCTPVGSCGSFTLAHTASGVPTSYTAPSSAGTVVVIASSTANPTKTAMVTITVAATFETAALSGNYVFEVRGRDSFAHVPPSAYQVAGVLQADGNGNITGGELLYEDQPGHGNNLDSITSGSYSVGADGRGTITLTTSDTSIGVNGVLTLSVAMLSGTRGLVTQFDASATSSGNLDLQTPLSAGTPLSGGYAFVTNGVDNANEAPLGVGGVLNVAGGTVQVIGSVMDANDNGTVTTNAAVGQGGTVTAPDLLGKIVINVSPQFPGGPSVILIGFIVDDTHVKLIEKRDGFGLTGGIAFAQGAATGTFTTASFAGTFVYTTSGYSTVGANALLPTAYAGLFTADGSGNITNGLTDLNQFGTVIYDTLTGKYAADSSGTGRVTTSEMFYGSNGEGPSWIFYLTGNTNVPALILQVDAAPFVETVGPVYTQAAGPFTASSFSGPYGLKFTAFPPAGGEDDGTGQITADGVGSLGPGKVDFNLCNFAGGLCPSFTPTSGVSLSGTFVVNSNGRFTGTLTDGNGAIFNTDPIAFYIVNSTQVQFIDIGAQPAVGAFEQQEQQ